MESRLCNIKIAMVKIKNGEFNQVEKLKYIDNVYKETKLTNNKNNLKK